MKMEADSLKMKSAQTVTDAGGLTFGPAWLRQLSSGDTNKNALPPSPGLAFQLSKHRYSREEMLAIYETIEKSLAQKSPPNLAEEFEELYKRDLQRPVLLTPPSLEEQKFLSTCVNSQVVLNTYNKIQGQPGSTNSSNSSNGSSQRNGDGGSRDSRGGSNSIRGSRGGGRGGMGSERGRGRGGMRGGGRGGHESSFKTIDEEGNPIANSGGRGGGRGGSASGSYRRAGWDEREGRDSNSSGLNGEKRYSKAMTEDNWRNRAAPAEESDSSSESKPTHSEEDGKNAQDGETNQTPSSSWRNSSEKTPSSQRDNWSTSKNSYQSGSYNERHNRDAYSKEKSSSRDHQPEWLDDDDEENTMTFDKSGNFVSVKELNKPTRSKEKSVEKQSDSNSRSQSRDTESNEPRTSESETTTTTADNKKVNDDIKTNENEEESSKSEDVDKVEQKEEEKTKPLTAEQEQQRLLDEKLNQMSLSDFSNLTSAADLLLSKNSLPTNNPNPSFESLQAIHQQLQQQQLKLKNELLLAQLNTDPKRGPVAGDHQDADRWFYLDPQNQIQGSFSSEQMAGWFTAGYFNMSLMVKRGRDEKFAPLGVVSNNWGRIPFTSGPQPFSTSPQQQQQQQQSQPVQVQPQQQQQQQQQQPSKEQIIQQMQLFQRFQQMQLMPQNINLLRNELSGNGNSMANLGGVLQQLQQLQIQQNAALAAANSIGPATASQIIQDIRSQQEVIISQFAANNNSNGNNSNSNNLHQNVMKEQHERQSLPDLDPAILGAAPSKSQSVWNDLSSGSRQSPINHLNPTPPPTQHSISPINFLQQQLQSNSQHSSTNSLNQLGQFANLDTNLLAQQIREFNSTNNSSGNAGSNNMVNMMMNDSNIKDKIQKLFEQTKQDEEKRRKLMEDQMKAKREEDEKRRKMMEEQLSREQEQRRIQEEEQRVREEQRKEQQRKKLAEIIIKQEEEKKKADEMKKKREEENKHKAKEEKLKEKQRHEAKKLELAEAERRLQEENQERRRQELYAEQQRKQVELERQRAKAQQDQLNNLQLPAHANWAKQNAQQQHQQQQAQLKSILEQQALESMQQRLLEQQKQAEMNALQQDRQSSWSSLFRGNAPPPASTPSGKEAKEPTPVSLASIQAEQIKKEPVAKAATTMSAKIQQATSQQPAAFKQSSSSKASSQQQSAWGSSQASPSASAWGTTGNGGVSSSTTHTSSKQQQSSVSQSSSSAGHNNDTSSYSNSNSNSNASTGFWTDISDKKSSKNAKQQQNKSQFPDLGNNHNNHADRNSSKTAKKMAAMEESVQQIFLRNMTISDEFMKWCHEQLKDFHVELHIPTFVNFLREIESCNEIEEYVVNYLGDSQHAKDFAHQFYINRESQIKQQNNLTDEQVEESTYAKESQFSKKQKKRSKGQRVDHQLLGFTVQPDPNLKNRGDIDPL